MEKVPFEESCTTLTLLRKAANGTTGQSCEEVTSESKPGRQSARGGRSGRIRTAQISLGHQRILRGAQKTPFLGPRLHLPCRVHYQGWGGIVEEVK